MAFGVCCLCNVRGLFGLTYIDILRGLNFKEAVNLCGLSYVTAQWFDKAGFLEFVFENWTCLSLPKLFVEPKIRH